MAVFRIERTRDYTVMSNHHLRNANLSLKAKGLLSMMLSLPEDWNYTTRGLAKICKEGVDAIGAALRELEAAGYIVRHKLRDRQGRISDTEYVIYEQPQLRKPDTDSPDTENPYMDKPDTEKPAELNIEKSNTQKQNIYGSSTDSIPFRDCAADCLPERKGRDAMSLTEIESYRELIQENNLRRNAKNFRITDEHLGEGGPKAKFQANVNAIRLLKELEAAGQQASPEQQEVLSRYVGWGGLSDAFDPEKPAWALEYAQLKELLTPEEYAAARSSTLNAHYTSPTVIQAIY